jgi:hypothetical protein
MKKLSAVLLFLMSGIAGAHQPRIIDDKPLSQANPMVVNTPEVSQIFYAELKGEPQYYRISSAREFGLYLQILSPKIENADRDFSAEIYRGNQIIGTLIGIAFNWTEFHEPFVGDDYWRGPEYKDPHAQGQYLIKIYSPDNKGKYALVVGQAESFPLEEWGKLILAMPRIKSYFGKSVLGSFFNLVGLFLLIVVVFIVAVFLGIRWIIKRIRKKLVIPRE